MLGKGTNTVASRRCITCCSPGAPTAEVQGSVASIVITQLVPATTCMMKSFSHSHWNRSLHDVKYAFCRPASHLPARRHNVNIAHSGFNVCFAPHCGTCHTNVLPQSQPCQLLHLVIWQRHRLISSQQASTAPAVDGQR